MKTKKMITVLRFSAKGTKTFETHSIHSISNYDVAFSNVADIIQVNVFETYLGNVQIEEAGLHCECVGYILSESSDLVFVFIIPSICFCLINYSKL